MESQMVKNFKAAVAADSTSVGGETGMVVSYIERDFIPFSFNTTGGHTVGQQMDLTIYQAAKSGRQIRSMTIIISDEEWQSYRAEFMQDDVRKAV